MCSVGDDNFDGPDADKYLPVVDPFKPLETKCNKCRTNVPKVVLQQRHAYCVDCFVAATAHKFKAFLGKHKLIARGEKVLVCHRAGHPSTAMLHFLRTGLEAATPKKLGFDVVFIYIEDKYDLSVSDRLALMKAAHKQVPSDIFFISLIDYLKHPDEVAQYLYNNEDNLKMSENDGETLSLLLSEKHANTNRTCVLQIFQRKLLVDVGELLGCKSAFTNELGVDVASQFMTNMALGRGSHIPLDIGVCDDRDPNFKIIRPLRTFHVKELALYNYFNQIEPLSVPFKGPNEFASLQNLMKNFVTNLQVNFPATVTTIVRTSDKLMMDSDMKDNTTCTFCHAPKESTTETLCSAESTQFSHWVSTRTPDYNITPVQRYNDTLQSFKSSQVSQYCYACKMLNKDLNLIQT